ncbi:hypothetical protein [Siphonobacter sp. SORGH_AS_1065]|nr:hypothetical protein [Siphonobacter sp. SORGH_AS_1065]MDQ1090438.1 hypothetical protein [Siphonobacter sp. SORGH_AS_1065]
MEKSTLKSYLVSAYSAPEVEYVQHRIPVPTGQRKALLDHFSVIRAR